MEYLRVSFLLIDLDEPDESDYELFYTCTPEISFFGIYFFNRFLGSINYFLKLFIFYS